MAHLKNWLLGFSDNEHRGPFWRLCRRRRHCSLRSLRIQPLEYSDWHERNGGREGRPLFSFAPRPALGLLCPAGDRSCREKPSTHQGTAHPDHHPLQVNISSEIHEPPVNCFLPQLLKGCPHSGPREMRQMCSFQFCRLPGEPRSCRLTIVGENMFPHVVGYLLSK